MNHHTSKIRITKSGIFDTAEANTIQNITQQTTQQTTQHNTTQHNATQYIIMQLKEVNIDYNSTEITTIKG